MASVRALPTLVAALLLAASAAPSLAQDIPSPYRFIERGQEAGLIVGYMDAVPGGLDFGPKGAPFYGGKYSVALGGLVSLGGTLTFMPTERDVVNPRRPEGDRILDDPSEVSLVNVTARLIFNLTGRRTWHSLQPFVALGGGVMFDVEGDQAEDQLLSDEDRFDFGTSFSGTLGGGTRLLLNERLALTGEIGLTLYQIDTPEGWFATELELDDVPENQWVNAGTFTLGLTYLF